MTQVERIREHLEKGRTLTPLEALDLFGCFRLSGRILELRQAGLDIKTDLVSVGEKKVARYSLASGQIGLFAA